MNPLTKRPPKATHPDPIFLSPYTVIPVLIQISTVEWKAWSTTHGFLPEPLPPISTGSWKRWATKIWESTNAPIWWYSAKATFLPFWSKSASSIMIRTMPCWIRNLTKQHGPLRTALQELSGPGKSAPLRKQQAHPFGLVPAGINYGCTCRRTADGGTAGKYEAYSFLHKQRNNRYSDYT